MICRTPGMQLNQTMEDKPYLVSEPIFRWFRWWVWVVFFGGKKKKYIYIYIYIYFEEGKSRWWNWNCIVLPPWESRKAAIFKRVGQHFTDGQYFRLCKPHTVSLAYSSSFCFFQPFKNVRIILSSRAVQKQGWIWPTSHVLPTCHKHLSLVFPTK